MHSLTIHVTSSQSFPRYFTFFFKNFTFAAYLKITTIYKTKTKKQQRAVFTVKVSNILPDCIESDIFKLKVILCSNC